MDKDMQRKLNRYLEKLLLTSVLKTYQESAQTAIQENLSYEEYLMMVIEHECEIRKTRRVERWIKESRIPREKTLASLDLKCFTQKLTRQIKIISEGDFVGHKENILVFGPPGSGKTHLVCGIGQELIRKGHRIYFTTCALLLQELLSAKKDYALPRLIKRLNKYEAIIIDDIGYVQQEKEEMEVLFTLLAERYERGSVMITSNLPFSRWEKIFKDPMMTTAVIDRIVHHSIILELNNVPSHRMDQAKAKKIREDNIEGGDK